MNERRLGASTRLRDRVRGHYEHWFPDYATVYRIVNTPRPDFGTDVAYELVATYPANKWSITGREAIIAQRLDIEVSAIVSMVWNADATAQYEIVYTVYETGEIHHYSVNYVHDGTRELAQNAYCTEYPLGEPRRAHQ